MPIIYDNNISKLTGSNTATNSVCDLIYICRTLIQNINIQSCADYYDKGDKGAL